MRISEVLLLVFFIHIGERSSEFHTIYVYYIVEGVYRVVKAIEDLTRHVLLCREMVFKTIQLVQKLLRYF